MSSILQILSLYDVTILAQTRDSRRASEDVFNLTIRDNRTWLADTGLEPMNRRLN